MQEVTNVQYNRPLHLLAVLTACATFPLIFMGGLVTSHQAGMSVPDWPNSWGYNMFLFPPRLWIGGILYEHTHRLMGTVVGFLAVLLALRAWAPARSSLGRRIIALAALACACAIGATLTILAFNRVGLIQLPLRLFSLAPHAIVGFASLLLVLTISFFLRVPEPR